MGENLKLYYIMIFRDKNQSNFLSYLNRQTMNPGQCEEQRLKVVRNFGSLPKS